MHNMYFNIKKDLAFKELSDILLGAGERQPTQLEDAGVLGALRSCNGGLSRDGGGGRRRSPWGRRDEVSVVDLLLLLRVHVLLLLGVDLLVKVVRVERVGERVGVMVRVPLPLPISFHKVFLVAAGMVVGVIGLVMMSSVATVFPAVGNGIVVVESLGLENLDVPPSHVLPKRGKQRRCVYFKQR